MRQVIQNNLSRAIDPGVAAALISSYEKLQARALSGGVESGIPNCA
jgi:hypothetical protein